MARMVFGPFQAVRKDPSGPLDLCALHKKRPVDILMCHVRLTFTDVTH